MKVIPPAPAELPGQTTIERVAQGGIKPAMMLNQHGFFGPETLSEGLPREYSPAVSLQVAELSEMLDQINKARQIVKNDPALTPIGKQERLKAITTKTSEAFQKVTADRQRGIDQDLKAAREDLPTEVPQIKAGDVVAEARQREIRDLLRAKDPIEAQQLILKGAKEGNDELASAAVNDPIGKLLNHSGRAAAIEAWQRAKYPEPFARIEALAEVQSQLINNARLAAQLIGTALGGDAIEVMAGKTPDVEAPNSVAS